MPTATKPTAAGWGGEPLRWEEEDAFLKGGHGKGKMFPKGVTGGPTASCYTRYWRQGSVITARATSMRTSEPNNRKDSISTIFHLPSVKLFNYM